MKRIFVSSLVFAAGMLIAADLTTKSGKVYENYRIVGVTDDGVSVSFRGGIAKIPMYDLPDDLREKYSAKDIQAKYAAEEKKKRALARQQSVARRRNAGLKNMTLDLEGEVICVQVLKSGTIATHGAYENNFYIDDLDVSRLADGSFVPPNANGMVHDWDAIFNKGKNNAMKPGKVLRLYCIGTFRYRAVSGAQITIPYFTVNSKRAADYLQKHPDAGIVGMQRKPDVQETGSDVRRRLRQENRIRQQNIRPQLRQQYRR